MGELQLKPDEFWNLTYAEINAMGIGYKRRNLKETNNIIFQAWYIEYMHRHKELPELKDILVKEEVKKEVQTSENMMTMCKILNAAYGGEFIET